MKLSATLAAAAALALVGAAGSAVAQTLPTEVYGSVGYTQFGIDQDGDDFGVDDSELNFGAVTGRAGAKLNRYFGAEGELQIGVNDAEETRGGVNVSAGLNYSASVFAVGYLPVAPNFDLLARVGVGVTEVEAEASGFGQTFSETESGTSVGYGVGAQYFFDGVNGVRGDYTRYDGEEDSAQADSLSLSYVRKF